MTSTGFWARLLLRVRAPWAMLMSTFGGLMAWVFGCSMPLASVTAAVMFATAVGIGGESREQSALRAGTQQHQLVMLFDGHVRSLRALRKQTLPGVVRLHADGASGAADAARTAVVQMAAAVDALDEAISMACKVRGRGEHAAESIGRSVDRLRARRDGLVEKLTAAVDEVATVYAGLLELAATVRTVGVGVDDGDVGSVNDSVTLLQMTFAELEADAARLTKEGLS